MASPEPTPERLEELLAGAAPADPAEREVTVLMAELRAAPGEAPASLRARVGALEPRPSALARLREALAAPALRRSALVAAPACSIALAAGIVIGLAQGGDGPAPGSAPAASEPMAATSRTAAPEAAADAGTEAVQAIPAPAAAPPAAAARGARGITVTGLAARTLPADAGAAERRAAYRAALAAATADARRKGVLLAGRAGLDLGAARSVVERSDAGAPCEPAPSGPGGAPADACTVSAAVEVSYALR